VHEAREQRKKNKIETGTKSATTNFKLRPVSRRKETKSKGKSGTRKFHMKS